MNNQETSSTTSPTFSASSNSSSDKEISSFQQWYLEDLQGRQTCIKPNELGRLRDCYKQVHESKITETNYPQKHLEQCLLSLPLYLISQPKPSHLTQLQYIRLILMVDEEMSYLKEQLGSSFN